MSLPAAAVIAASNAWTWIPDDATTVETDEYVLVRSPDYFSHPLALIDFHPSGAAGAAGESEAAGESGESGSVAAAVAAVLDRARQFGLPALYWHVRLGSPPGVAGLLAARGATVAETLDILALDLRHGAPALPPPTGDVDVRWATDPVTARDSSLVGTAVFGGTMPPAERLADNAERDSAGVPAGDGGMLVAYADGTPVGAGGVTMADGVARLWGGSVVESARGQGVYRAVLAARLAYGAAHGATMALVKARVETSGPILRRAGFRAYGQEINYDVPLA